MYEVNFAYLRSSTVKQSSVTLRILRDIIYFAPSSSVHLGMLYKRVKEPHPLVIIGKSTHIFKTINQKNCADVKKLTTTLKQAVLKSP